MVNVIKLTERQKKVVRDLQNGWSLITDSEVKGAWLSKSGIPSSEEYHIDNGVFWRMVSKRIIAQQINPPHNYVLTNLGKSIKL